MMYLRHEAGHAFNYAYRLYETAEWRELFGPFRRPYRENYRPVPFSRRFVRHIDGWYAQKHPDEDFAETFAVWLTPRLATGARSTGDGEPWRSSSTWTGWRASSATSTRCAPRGGRTSRSRRWRRPSPTSTTTRSSSRSPPRSYRSKPTLPTSSSPRAAARRGSGPPSDLMRENRQAMIDKVTYWTGVQRPLVKRLVEAIESKVGELDSAGGREVRKGAPDRGHGLRDGARDELPDARKVRAVLSMSDMTPKLKVAVLYDLWEEQEPPPEPPPEKPVRGKRRKKKREKADREEIFEALGQARPRAVLPGARRRREDARRARRSSTRTSSST